VNTFSSLCSIALNLSGAAAIAAGLIASLRLCQSHRKVGGLHFVRLGRVSVSFCLCSRKPRKAQFTAAELAKIDAYYAANELRGADGRKLPTFHKARQSIAR
jgi:hypothetical protein